MTQLFFRSLSLLSVIVIMFATSSCDTVLQYPDGEGMDPNHPEGEAWLHIAADASFAMLGEFEYDFENPANMSNAISRSAFEQHQLRYLIKVFDASDKSVSPTPKAVFSFTDATESEIDKTVQLKLMPGDYRIVVWADYVNSDSADDKYYNTDDFAEIKLQNDNSTHPGSNEFRDAFCGEASIHINQPYRESTSASIVLKRPMAKYTFVSNDLADFLDKEATRTRNVIESDPAYKPESALQDYTARIIYTRYMPVSYNVFNNKPADAKMGVEYRSMMSMLDDDHAQLAFDYVFTNGTETSITVAMEVIYKDGTIVSRVPQFDVPLKRSHHTIITGKFLTTKSGGPIGINPDYTDSFNVEIK